MRCKRKVISLRLDPGLHAEVVTLARLHGRSLNDEIIVAITDALAAAPSDPAIAAHATAHREAIVRSAREQLAALSAIAGSQADAPLRQPGAGPRPTSEQEETTQR